MEKWQGRAQNDVTPWPRVNQSATETRLPSSQLPRKDQGYSEVCSRKQLRLFIFRGGKGQSGHSRNHKKIPSRMEAEASHLPL